MDLQDHILYGPSVVPTLQISTTAMLVGLLITKFKTYHDEMVSGVCTEFHENHTINAFISVRN